LSSRGEDEQEPGEETNPGILPSWDNTHIMATSRKHVSEKHRPENIEIEFGQLRQA
jgi:hypothetical protein